MSHASGTLIREIPEHDRPQERLERLGPQSLTDAELLAVILRTGRRGVSVVQLGENLLQHFGGLSELTRRSVAELSQVGGVGRVKACMLKAAFDLHERVSARAAEEVPMDTPSRIRDLLMERTRPLTVEVLFGLALDSKMRLLRCYEITRGLLNQTLVHAREVYREAIASSAGHLVLAHNHPSGDPTPSQEDVKATRDMVNAGRLLGIPLVDHVIIGRPSPTHPRGYVSLKECGVLF